jgi:hypothetical protein
MKILHKFLMIAAAAVALSACEQEPDKWLQENIQEGRGYFPVIASASVTAPALTDVKPGSEVTVDLRYWSRDPIQEVRLYARPGATAVETLVSTTPYTPAYSEVSRTDSMLLKYAVPADLVPAKGALRLRAEVVNENTLTKSITLPVIDIVP